MAMTPNDTYHSLLMDYAAGTLDEAFSLVIATHLSLSSDARKIVMTYEDVGGGLLEECCTPVAMQKDALDCVMRKLENICDDAEQECEKHDARCAEIKAMPPCLRIYMDDDADHLPWKATSPGLRTIAINTKCKNSRAEIMKMEAGALVPRNTHKRYEIVLILDGVFEDSGHSFTRGDLVVSDGPITHRPAAGKETGCMCLSVARVPLHMTGFLGTILNLFIK